MQVGGSVCVAGIGNGVLCQHIPIELGIELFQCDLRFQQGKASAEIQGQQSPRAVFLSLQKDIGVLTGFF